MTLTQTIGDTLHDKGYMPTEVGIAPKLNAITIRAIGIEGLRNTLQSRGANVTILGHFEVLCWHDDNNKILKILEDL